MRTILFLTTLFLFAGLAVVSQEQANVQFSVRVADFQSIQIDNNTPTIQSGAIKTLENNNIQIVGTSPYELQVSTHSISGLLSSTNFDTNKSLTISSHDVYDNTNTVKVLSNNEAKILQSSKTSMELFYNPSDFLLATSQVATKQVIAYSLMPN